MTKCNIKYVKMHSTLMAESYKCSHDAKYFYMTKIIIHGSGTKIKHVYCARCDTHYFKYKGQIDISENEYIVSQIMSQ